jgi:hypothetical protein
MPDTTTDPFWAIVEIFGHQRLAGLVSEFSFGGETFVRVDVPASAERHAFTKLYGKGAIYAISFVDESIARAAAARLDVRPITAYDVGALFKDADPQERLRLSQPSRDFSGDDETE